MTISIRLLFILAIIDSGSLLAEEIPGFTGSWWGEAVLTDRAGIEQQCTISYQADLTNTAYVFTSNVKCENFVHSMSGRYNYNFENEEYVWQGGSDYGAFVAMTEPFQWILHSYFIGETKTLYSNSIDYKEVTAGKIGFKFSANNYDTSFETRTTLQKAE